MVLILTDFHCTEGGFSGNITVQRIFNTLMFFVVFHKKLVKSRVITFVIGKLNDRVWSSVAWFYNCVLISSSSIVNDVISSSVICSVLYHFLSLNDLEKLEIMNLNDCLKG